MPGAQGFAINIDIKGESLGEVDAIKTLFLHAGAGWVLWLLGLLSLASVSVALERWLYFRKRRGDVRALSEQLDRLLWDTKIAEAIDMLQKSPAVAASVAASGLRLASLGPEAVERAMASATALERSKLEARLAFLGTLGNNAPFVGLFGTVIGVIQAFEQLGTGQDGGAAAAASQSLVMSAIAEALVATAVGIAVALPAVAAYNYLQRQVAALLSEAEVLTNLVLAYLLRRDQPTAQQAVAPQTTLVD